MCRVNLNHNFRHHITSYSLIRRLFLLGISAATFTSFFSLGWPRRTYAREPGATAVADKLGSVLSAGQLSTDDKG